MLKVISMSGTEQLWGRSGDLWAERRSFEPLSLAQLLNSCVNLNSKCPPGWQRGIELLTEGTQPCAWYQLPTAILVIIVIRLGPADLQCGLLACEFLSLSW